MVLTVWAVVGVYSAVGDGCGNNGNGGGDLLRLCSCGWLWKLSDTNFSLQMITYYKKNLTPLQYLSLPENTD